LISEINNYIDRHSRLPDIDFYYRFSGVAYSPDPQHWSRIGARLPELLAANASSGKQRVQNPKPIIAPLHPQAAPHGAGAHGTSPPPPPPFDLPPEFDTLKIQMRISVAVNALRECSIGSDDVSADCQDLCLCHTSTAKLLADKGPARPVRPWSPSRLDASL